MFETAFHQVYSHKYLARAMSAEAGRHTKRAIPRLSKGSTKGRDAGNKGKRESTDSHSPDDGSSKPAKPVLSLQGPFKPAIVGNLCKGDKRKFRDGNTKSSFLPTVQSAEDISPKRNQTKEKNKCKVDFNKIDTNFKKSDGENAGKATMHKFTAKGPTSKPPMKGFYMTPKTLSYRELKKSEEELQGQVLQLQVNLEKLQLNRSRNVIELQTQLQKANDKISSLEQDLSELRQHSAEAESKNKEILENQAMELSARNQALQKRVEQCISKLKECDIDPVSLQSKMVNDANKENNEIQASNQAKNLKDKLTTMTEKNQKMLLNMKTILESQSFGTNVNTTEEVDEVQDIAQENSL